MRIISFFAFAGMFLAACSTADARDGMDLSRWVAGVKQEARAEGISPQLLDRAFRSFRPNPKIIELDQKQPESTLLFEDYLDRIVSETRIEEGRSKLREHRALLEKISRETGVEPQMIVALWGIETNYGKNTGGFEVIEALATLAYDGRRSEFFRSELLKALHILDKEHISLENMKGSWAGAMGQCQFMPSSFLNFAVDYNKDGRKDIWTSLPDVFASIANYLAQSGWERGSSWGQKVMLPQNFDYETALSEDNIAMPLSQWMHKGVRDEYGKPLQASEQEAYLIFPDDEMEVAYLVHENYKTIMKWNRSRYFATAVGTLADSIAMK